jgi:RNA polymerase sigma factor (sigma-70 family)
MAAGQLDCVIRHIRKVARAGQVSQIADAELLERFMSHRDERAFELLVRRHGPMVLGVCKRVLRNESDAEDAFQATFLVFVRKASCIAPRAKVGNWLYGVAYKTALKARAMNRRTSIKEREAGVAAMREAADDGWACLLSVLDDELGLLPERYRTPIVLCDLEGLSYKEAAARIGCPQGTLSGRLTRARVLLARRLVRHGLTLPGGILATLLARNASAAVPPALMALTVQAGSVLATGKVLATGTVSPKVALLAEGVMKMLLLTKLKIVTGISLLTLMLLATGWMYALQAPAHAGASGDNAVREATDDTRPPDPKKGDAIGKIECQEAEFIFRSEDRSKKTMSLVVAGTSAPVLNLPVKDVLRVFIGRQRVESDRLRSCERISIQMDATNSSIQEIRSLEDVRNVPVFSNAKDTDLLPPSDAEVLRAMPRATRGVPIVYEESRDEIRITTERLVDKVDPPRFFPLIGKAELHRCLWKCTVAYTETVESADPFPFQSKASRTDVIYIDKDYLVILK